jgi:hypothetical protein
MSDRASCSPYPNSKVCLRTTRTPASWEGARALRLAGLVEGARGTRGVEVRALYKELSSGACPECSGFRASAAAAGLLRLLRRTTVSWCCPVADEQTTEAPATVSGEGP